jgi:hypothetical protein
MSPEYGWPVAPEGRVLVVTANGAAMVIARLVDCSCVGDDESLTVTVNGHVPGLDGIPEIAPVEALSTSPDGRVPERSTRCTASHPQRPSVHPRIPVR